MSIIESLKRRQKRENEKDFIIILAGGEKQDLAEVGGCLS